MKSVNFETAYTLLKKIVERCHFTEIGFTEVRHPISESDTLDIVIRESIYHWQLQELDQILADYDNIEMQFDAGNSQFIIFSKEPENP